MKINSLLDQYIFSRKALRICMPIVTTILILATIFTIITMPEIWWISLIFLGIDILVIIELFLIQKYLNKKIKELTDKDSLNIQMPDIK